MFDRWKLKRLGQRDYDLLELRARAASHFAPWDLEQIYLSLKRDHEAQLLAIKNGFRFQAKVTPI